MCIYKADIYYQQQSINFPIIIKNKYFFLIYIDAFYYFIAKLFISNNGIR